MLYFSCLLFSLKNCSVPLLDAEDNKGVSVIRSLFSVLSGINSLLDGQVLSLVIFTLHSDKKELFECLEWDGVLQGLHRFFVAQSIISLVLL